jgi:hypothetical protein
LWDASVSASIGPEKQAMSVRRSVVAWAPWRALRVVVVAVALLAALAVDWFASRFGARTGRNVRIDPLWKTHDHPVQARVAVGTSPGM